MKKLNQTIIYILMLFTAPPSIAEPMAKEQKKQLMMAIQVKPNCDVANVDRLTKIARGDLSPSDKVDIVVEKMRSNCTSKELIETDQKKMNKYILMACQQIWKDWHEDYYPRAMKGLKRGLSFDKMAYGDETYALGIAFGMANMICKNGNKDACKLHKQIDVEGQKEMKALENASK